MGSKGAEFFCAFGTIIPLSCGGVGLFDTERRDQNFILSEGGRNFLGGPVYLTRVKTGGPVNIGNGLSQIDGPPS